MHAEKGEMNGLNKDADIDIDIPTGLQRDGGRTGLGSAH